MLKRNGAPGEENAGCGSDDNEEMEKKNVQNQVKTRPPYPKNVNLLKLLEWLSLDDDDEDDRIDPVPPE